MHQPLRHSSVLLASVLAGAFLLAPPALRAQQDSSMGQTFSAPTWHETVYGRVLVRKWALAKSGTTIDIAASFVTIG